MKPKLHSLSHPAFLISLVLLLLNDWYFKPVFHNELTGKLSDFAGLLAFPFFWSVLFPKYTRAIHLGTVVLFLFWNSSLSEPLMSLSREIGFPFYRTIDPSDFWALTSILASYLFLKGRVTRPLSTRLTTALIVISCFAFCATSRVHPHLIMLRIEQRYDFEFSREELVYRLNMIQLKQVQKTYGQVNFNGENNSFHYPEVSDTLALLLDYDQLKHQDTIVYQSVSTRFLIMGNEHQSFIILKELRPELFPSQIENAEQWSVKDFEKRVIKKIEKYRSY